MKKEDMDFLNQLVGSLEKAEMRLELAYKNQNYEEFNKLKKFILEIQGRIGGLIE
jgi:exonuclease VII small subunit